jgi:hypothetical protein
MHGVTARSALSVIDGAARMPKLERPVGFTTAVPRFLASASAAIGSGVTRR